MVGAMTSKHWIAAATCAVAIALAGMTPAAASTAGKSPQLHSGTQPRAAVQVPGAPIQIAAGHAHTCELLNTRSVECWGSNYYGQLGDGTNTDTTRPVPVTGLTGVAQLALGYGHSCALLTTGVVKCWGWNSYGQLGDGTNVSRLVPVTVQGLPRVLQISLGFESSCALLVTRTVKCWGWNAYGQLGDGSNSPSLLPVTIGGLTGVRQIGAGYAHTCAVLVTSRVRCWGWNIYGQLGDGNLQSTTRPVYVPGLVGARGVALGFEHTCALMDNGTIRCWGWNHYGQLGDGATTNTTTPVVVRGINDAEQVSISYGHDCALLRTHRVVCWGWNGFGQLGTGSVRSSPLPVGARNLVEVLQIVVGDDVSCALLQAHVYSCWGANVQGELGNGSYARVLTPAIPPQAPMAVHVRSGNGSALVSWHPPRFNGGSRITSYTAISRDRQHFCTTARFSCTVSNLTNGQTYVFTVAATNAIGTGRPSAPLPTLPSTVPGPPLLQLAQRADRSALVTWAAPASDGGLPITQYKATSDAGPSCASTGSLLSCSVLGLTNGTAYTFKIAAQNADGWGPSSAATVAVIPAAVPGQPTGVGVTPANASAVVHWLAAPTNGSVITGYTVTATDTTNSTAATRTCSWTTGPLTCTVTGLTNGDAYTFVVAASNTVGLGPTSTPPFAATPATVPNPPTGVVAVAGNGDAKVTWVAPIVTGGSPITGYKVTAADSTIPPGGQTCTWTSGPLTCTVSGLTNGNSYTFTVTATNVMGTGSPSAPSAAVTPATIPGAPVTVTASPGNGSALVSWSAPASNGGASITSYKVTASDSTTPPGGQTCSTAGSLSCTVSGLASGDTYTFTVTATNRVGTGPSSAASPPITIPNTPGAPSAVTATPGDSSASVDWSAPSDGGSPITSYTVTAAPGGQTCTWTSGPLTCTVSGLTNGDSYTFTVTATNGVGTGPSSSPSSPVTPATVPDAPQGVSAVPGVNSAAVSWSAPASDGGSPITSYTVTAADSTNPPGGQTCTWTSGPLTCTVTGLATGDVYTFTVTATNAIGTGPASAPSSSVISLIPVLGSGALLTTTGLQEVVAVERTYSRLAL
jgi:alpha-tubulin suppressor-like RCC1 family protein